MSVRQATRFAVLTMLAWYGPVVYAGAPMELPMATVEEGQWALGLGYGYGETDWQAHGLTVYLPDGGSPSYSAEFININELQNRVVLATLTYGVVDTWNLFLRFGVSDAQDHIRIHTTPPSGTPERFGYDGNYGLAWGIGTRATFCHWGPWRFGALAQVTWFDPKDSDFSSSDPDVPNTVFVGHADIEFRQTQIALTAAYQIDTLTFWAGPFLQFVDGELDRSGRTVVNGTDSGSFRSSADLQESMQTGLHLGVSWEASTKFNGQIEGQFTEDSWFVGIGGSIRPEQFFAKP